MKNKILIVAPYQFGELSDCYYWAKYLDKSKYDVAYFGYKYRNRNIKDRRINGVDIYGVYRFYPNFLFGMFFIINLIWYILKSNTRDIIICRFKFSYIIPLLFFKRNVVLDIRTLSVSENNDVRKKYNNKIFNESLHFKKVSVISEGIINQFPDKCRTYLLPLGAEEISTKEKKFDNINMLYIGTFINRKLHIFLEALLMYEKKNNCYITFDIIGSGGVEEERIIKNMVLKFAKFNVVYHGYLNHEEAKPIFDKCNVGVCFVPITEYYDYQPPTKLYEYLLSGMACIATNTYSNAEVINQNNGVLIVDTIEGCYEGLVRLLEGIHTYDSKKIRLDSINYHWKNIVEKYLLKLL